VCLSDATCDTCAEGYALVAGACALRAPTPVMSLPADRATPVTLTLAVPTMAGPAQRVCRATYR